MSKNIPPEFKSLAKYLEAGLKIESINPAVCAWMKNFFYENCVGYTEEYPVSPQAQQFLQSFAATLPQNPPNGPQLAQEFADDFFASLNNQFNDGNLRYGMISDFQICALIFGTLDGEQNAANSNTCKLAAVKIKKMMNKQLQKGKNEGGSPPQFSNTSGGPPVFTPQGGSSGGPPVFTPQGGSSGGPPVFTPQGGSSGGPPVFTPQGGSSGGPPVFTPQGGSSGGPPVFTSQGGSSGGPPVFTPNNSGAPPSYQPSSPAQFKPPVDPKFDVDSAKHLLQSLGYNIVNSSNIPPLNQQSYVTVESYLDYALKGIKDSDKETCLGYLKDALNSWNSGGYA